jgi:rhodanese-related sulfurtransferase
MKIKTILLLLFPTFSQWACGQNPRPTNVSCQNPKFDRTVAAYLSFSITPIDVDSLKKNQAQFLILDAREKREYEVSHIEGARFCGYENFDAQLLNDIPKNQAIVIYCSIGYRSEKIGEKLKKLGFTKVFNLYGSIFEWVNRGNTLLDAHQKPTNKIHTYNESWSKWVQNNNYQKVTK